MECLTTLYTILYNNTQWHVPPLYWPMGPKTSRTIAVKCTIVFIVWTFICSINLIFIPIHIAHRIQYRVRFNFNSKHGDNVRQKNVSLSFYTYENKSFCFKRYFDVCVDLKQKKGMHTLVTLVLVRIWIARSNKHHVCVCMCVYIMWYPCWCWRRSERDKKEGKVKL